MQTAGAHRRRVVVTGVGCISPLGIDASATWSAVVAGQSGTAAIENFDASQLPVRIAAECSPDIEVRLPPKESRRLDRCIQLAAGAADEAWKAAGLDTLDAKARDEIGVAIGTGIGGIGTLLTSHERLLASPNRRVNPFTIPSAIGNMSSGYVSLRHGLRGPNLSPIGACASGGQAVGEAMCIVARGHAEVMLAGGTDAAIHPLVVVGFAAMNALSQRNDEPKRASRPFDLDRDGFVLGEGSGILVLESLEHARARGAPLLAEVIGYGAAADAAHMAAPAEDGGGACLAMRRALEDADLEPSQVDYLNAHATSTPAGDRIEARAIREVFGRHVDRMPVSATKSMTGHLLGAAGAVESILCVRALETGLVPPTINLDQPDPECELDHVTNKARQANVEIALSNSFGFGGVDTTLAFGRAPE